MVIKLKFPVPCWCERAEGTDQTVVETKECRIPSLNTTHRNPWRLWAPAAGRHHHWVSLLPTENRKRGYSLHRLTKIRQVTSPVLTSLDFSFDIQMEVSEFAGNSMKSQLHPALHGRLRPSRCLLLVAMLRLLPQSPHLIPIINMQICRNCMMLSDQNHWGRFPAPC